MPSKVGVVLMTYGSATRAEQVTGFLNHIYRGSAPMDAIARFEERYRLIGQSPLVEITATQARLLESLLNETGPDRVIIRSGMLHSEPWIEQALHECKAAGVDRFIGIILSPQFSSAIMEGYRAAFFRAAEHLGIPQTNARIVDPWPTQPDFILLLMERIQASLQELQSTYQATVPVIFTTHSLPKRVVENDPGYLGQLKATTDAILKQLDDPSIAWTSAYQSAGHSPEDWLKPDLTDVLSELRDKHAPAVLLVPIQFLADHLEVLYDLDIAAKQQCVDFGMAYHRIELPNVHPRFIQALSSLVQGV